MKIDLLINRINIQSILLILSNDSIKYVTEYEMVYLVYFVAKAFIK